MSKNIYFYFDYSNLQRNREISQETQNRITIFFHSYNQFQRGCGWNDTEKYWYLGLNLDILLTVNRNSARSSWENRIKSIFPRFSPTVGVGIVFSH